MYFKLEILYVDDTHESIIVKRVSDISNKSRFFYYEQPNDERGKGTSIEKSKIKCFECNINN